MRGVLEDCQSIETNIMYNLEQMGCNVLTEHDNLVTKEEITLEYTVRVNVDLDSEEFGSHTMNRFASYKLVVKRL